MLHNFSVILVQKDRPIFIALESKIKSNCFIRDLGRILAGFQLYLFCLQFQQFLCLLLLGCQGLVQGLSQFSNLIFYLTNLILCCLQLFASFIAHLLLDTGVFLLLIHGPCCSLFAILLEISDEFGCGFKVERVKGISIGRIGQFVMYFRKKISGALSMRLQSLLVQFCKFRKGRLTHIIVQKCKKRQKKGISILAQQNQMNMDDILNNSYFKNNKHHKYSFPKSDRFPHIKSNYTIDYFQASSQQSRRSTGFGYGSKYDFYQERSRSPGPSQYFPDNSMLMTKNLSLGAGRDVKIIQRKKIKTNSYIDPAKLKTPRIGQYETDNIKLKTKSPSCVIVERKPCDSFLKPDRNPDPGKYHPIDSFCSRRKRSSQFGFGSSKRFDTNKSMHRIIKDKPKDPVGPGAYNLPQQPKKQNAFGRTVRKTYAVEELEKSISPGPKYYVR